MHIAPRHAILKLIATALGDPAAGSTLPHTVLRIYLFGNLQALDGDVALPPPHPPKMLALWAYLLLRRGQALSRDQVAFALWPDVPEAEARANLRRHLHLLRHYLPSTPTDRPWFLTAHGTIQWNRDADYWLDAEAFEQMADSPPTEEAIGHLQAAIGYYRGDLLENLYDDWALVARERLRQQYTQVLERLTALQEAAGDRRGALITAQRLLAHDRLHEETHRLVMQLYYLAGDRAAALRQFEECQRLLRKELDVEPMPETLVLRQAILQGRGGDKEQRRQGAGETRRGGEGEAVAPPHPHPISPSPRPPVPWPLTRFLWMLVPVLLAIVAGALLVWRTVLPAPVTVTLSGPGVAQDTWITSEIPNSLFDPEFPKELFKDYSQVHLQFYSGNLDRILIRFDLSTLPANARVEKASLLVHLETWTAEPGRHSLQWAYPATVAAYRIRRPWQPETATYRTPWTQPGLAPGADYDAQPLDSQSISGTIWLAFDTTRAVRDWLAYPDDNWGFMLQITAAPEGVAHYWVDTTDHPAPDRRPRLMVTYRPGAAAHSDIQTLALTGADVVDTWITSGLPHATSAVALRGQPADELIRVADVTPAVQMWQRGATHGLLLTVQEATEGLAPYWMATREFPNPAFRPRLQIRYLSD